MMTREEVENICNTVATVDVDWLVRTAFACGIKAHDQAQRAVIAELRNLCLEAYQVVGSLAGDAGMFEHPATTKVLDNLSMAGTGKSLPHKELLPYPASQQIEQQAKEIESVLRECRSVGYESLKDLIDSYMSIVSGYANLREQNTALREALQLLYDCQNGCPLPKYEADWTRAMELAARVLKEVSG